MVGSQKRCVMLLLKTVIPEKHTVNLKHSAGPGIDKSRDETVRLESGSLHQVHQTPERRLTLVEWRERHFQLHAYRPSEQVFRSRQNVGFIPLRIQFAEDPRTIPGNHFANQTV